MLGHKGKYCYTENETLNAVQVMEDIARSMVEEAAEQVEAASKEASMWKERHQQQTNKMSQVEQRVRGAGDRADV